MRIIPTAAKAGFASNGYIDCAWSVLGHYPISFVYLHWTIVSRYGSIDIIHPSESGECPRLAGSSIQSKAPSID